jgi:glycosyltransferase involved in cell wall biosynthesis
VDADVIVAHGPHLTAWCAFFAKLLKVRAQIMGFSFNFTELPTSFKRRAFGWMLKRADRLVVFSRFERELYAKTFRLPVERLDFIPWAVSPPTVESPNVPLEPGRYACAIGGNARDYATLLSAAARLPRVHFVLVVRPESLRGLTVPANVTVHVNLPMGKAMNVLAFADFMVLPLLHSEVPCGHVTLVAAMHLGKAFVITKSVGIEDYVHAENNALQVEAGSATELAAAIERLWNDSALCARLGENGRHFATRYCTEQVAADYLRKWLSSIGLSALSPISADRSV